HPFDLGRVDLLAAPVDDVIGAADEVEEAVLVEAAEVAGGEPAAGPAGRAGDEAVLGGGPVLVDDVVAADLDGADDVGPDGMAGLVHDADVDADALPHRARTALPPVERVGGDLAGGLGHAVGLE